MKNKNKINKQIYKNIYIEKFICELKNDSILIYFFFFLLQTINQNSFIYYIYINNSNIYV